MAFLYLSIYLYGLLLPVYPAWDSRTLSLPRVRPSPHHRPAAVHFGGPVTSHRERIPSATCISELAPSSFPCHRDALPCRLASRLGASDVIGYE